jgi:transposase-like protein
VRKSKFSEGQIAFALKQNELGTSVDEVCRKMGISEATFYVWKKKYSGIGLGAAPIAPARGREQEAQADRRGAEPGQSDAAGRCRKKV